MVVGVYVSASWERDCVGDRPFVTMTGLGEAKRLQGMHVAPGAFEMLGVEALLGA